MWKFVVSTLAACALATPVSVVHEKRIGREPLGWQKRSSLDTNAIVPVRIGLTQRNIDKGYEHVMSVAHPASEQYGRHWSWAQIQKEFQPSELSAQLVQDWLSDQGIANAKQTSNKGWIAFNAPVSKVEQLFNTKYFEYQSKDGSTRLGCEEYSLPEHLSAHVDYITPGVTLTPIMTRSERSIGLSSRAKNRHLPKQNLIPLAENRVNNEHAVSSRSSEPQDCTQSVTIACLQEFYNLPAPINQLNPLQLGVFEQTDAYSTADLDEYYAAYLPYIPNGTYPHLVSIDNGVAPQAQNSTYNGGESDIDFETVYGLLGPVNVTLYQTMQPFFFVGNFSEYEATFVDPFLAAIDGSFCDEAEKENYFQCGTANLTNVVSVSYGVPEVGVSSLAAQQRVCNEFMKYSLKGHTFVFASGDSGVSQSYAGICSVTGCLAPGNSGINGSIYQTNFPTNCPYVLAVGGTQLNADQSVSAMNIPELAAEESECTESKTTYSSGGGFANYFSQPSYQKSAVEAYFANHDPGYKYYNYSGADIQSNSSNLGANGGIYNRLGRGYPDVSANGYNFASVLRGEYRPSNGTSLAAPIWASIIALLNEARSAAGKGPVGFVNPTLYENPSAMIDITQGNNPGCNTNGYSAVPGWDPITGLGAPNYTALHEVFMALP